MVAEGGTEYGHMITYARSESVWGEFTGYSQNPVLTNRNKGPYIIQGIGHGDLVEDEYGDWHIVSLGYRQIHMWMPYHNLGREVFLTPVTFGEDGWFSAGNGGFTEESYEIQGDFEQQEQTKYTFENTDWKIEWCFLRHPDMDNYSCLPDKLIMHGTDITLDSIDSPTFIALRQRDFEMCSSVDVSIDCGEAGLTLYMCENEHYDIAIHKTKENTYEIILKLNIGDIKHVQNKMTIESSKAKLICKADHLQYHFSVISGDEETILGSGQTKYLSSEVSGGFTGTMIGLYAVGNNQAIFSNFKCEYK